MSPALLTLIALTIIALGVIVALLLKIRADRIAAQPVFGTLGGVDRRSNPYWRNRAHDFWSDVPDYDEMFGAEPESKAKAEAGKAANSPEAVAYNERAATK